MTHGRQISVEETIEKLEGVTLEQVNAIAREFFVSDKVAFGALGDLKGIKIDRTRLALS